jgi:hypothetical protein
VINEQSVPDYTVHTGILRYKGRICIGNDMNLKNKILSSLHSFAIGGHSGICATYHRLKRIFHLPLMKKSIETYFVECAVCQRAKSEHCQYPGLMAPLLIPNLAWTFISMECIDGLSKSGTKDVILVVVDRLTKYAHFIALFHPYSVQTVAQVFIDQISRLHGAPVAIVTDKDCIFTSHLWQDIFKALNVSLHYSLAHHPQIDGQKERVNQCLENYLRCMASLEQKNGCIVSPWLNGGTTLITTPPSIAPPLKHCMVSVLHSFLRYSFLVLSLMHWIS